MLAPVTASLVVVGVSHEYWTAYSFIDDTAYRDDQDDDNKYSKEEREYDNKGDYDEKFHCLIRDGSTASGDDIEDNDYMQYPFCGGNVHTVESARDPRKWFISMLESRVREIKAEWTYLVTKLSKVLGESVCEPLFQPKSGSFRFSARF